MISLTKEADFAFLSVWQEEEETSEKSFFIDVLLSRFLFRIVVFQTH